MDTEKLPHCRQGAGGVSLRLRVGMLIEKAEFPDQMGKTELGAGVVVIQVFVIGGVIIAADYALITQTKDTFQHSGCPGLVDVEDGEVSGTEHPSPEALAFFPVTGLVNVEDRFVPDTGKDFVVGRFEGDGDSPKRLGDLPPRQSLSQDVFHKGGKGGVGGMTLGVEKHQGGGKVVADKAGASGVSRKLGAVECPARSAPISRSAVFTADKRVGTQVD